ncbi:MAG: HAMP domain-containing sensor histidine kinase [Sulfitobacter sp.]|jgi:signal transduction histidine kinase
MEAKGKDIEQNGIELSNDIHSRIKRLKDYAHVGQKLSLQRTIIYSLSVFLAGFYYDPTVAMLFFVAIIAWEIYDVLLLRYILRTARDHSINIRKATFHVALATALSAATIALFCVAIAIQQGVGGNHFLPLFLLVSASIFAAMNNHQFLPILGLRLFIYVVAILYIPIRDVWIVRPPITSEIWLNLFTVLFVVGFILELARSFLTGYSSLLKSRLALEIEHKHALAASEAKTRFLATVSHELRTPLTSIKGALDIINSGNSGEIPEKMARLLEMAGRNSNRLNDLVVDLLLLQSSDAGKFSLDMTRIDLGNVVNDAVTSFHAYAQTTGVVVVCDINPHQFYIVGDKKRLDQVVTNLLSNAAKFSNSNDDIYVKLVRDGDDVVLSVQDNGIGIPENSETKVFEEFGQIDSSDQRRFQGTGLGLAVSKRIVEAHGGTIYYESTLGVGSTFYVRLKSAIPDHEGNSSAITLP